jgi:hypothetical protein
MESIGKDDKMGRLLDSACRALAKTWKQTLERQNELVWMAKEPSPRWKIRNDGVLVKGKTGVEGSSH